MVRTSKEIKADVASNIRTELSIGLGQCTEGQIRKFKRIFCLNLYSLTNEAAASVVSDDKLDSALDLVCRTIKNNTLKTK